MEDDTDITIYLRLGAEHHIMNMMYDPDSVPEKVKFSYERSEKFPIEISIRSDEYIDEDNNLFDMLYASEIAEDIAESMITYQTIYLNNKNKETLEQVMKKDAVEKEIKLSYRDTPTTTYSWEITIRKSYSEDKGWERYCSPKYFFPDRASKYNTSIKKAPQKTIQHYIQLRKEEQEEERKQQEQKAQEKEKERQQKEEREKLEEQDRKAEQEKEERLKQPYSLEAVLQNEENQEEIKKLRSKVRMKKAVLLYTDVGSESEAFFDDYGRFISLIHGNDAIFREEYQGPLFEHFGVAVEYLNLPKEIDERIEEEMYKEDLLKLVEKYVEPYVQAAVQKQEKY